MVIKRRFKVVCSLLLPLKRFISPLELWSLQIHLYPVHGFDKKQNGSRCHFYSWTCIFKEKCSYTSKAHSVMQPTKTNKQKNQPTLRAYILNCTEDRTGDLYELDSDTSGAKATHVSEAISEPHFSLLSPWAGASKSLWVMPVHKVYAEIAAAIHFSVR